MTRWTVYVKNNREDIGDVRPVCIRGEWGFRARCYEYLDAKPIPSLTEDWDDLEEAVEYIRDQWRQTCDEYAAGIAVDLPAGWSGHPDVVLTRAEMETAHEASTAIAYGQKEVFYRHG